jgi:hypothetical protein
MRNSLKVVAVGGALMLGPFSADALSGDELYAQCNANKQLVVGYVAGALDKAAADSDILIKFYFETYDVLKSRERIEKDNQTLTKSSLALDGYCIPETTTLEQEANVYCMYLADHPAERSRSAADLWVTAAKGAWSCQ